MDKNKKERTKLEGELSAVDKNRNKLIDENSVERIIKEKRIRELSREKRAQLVNQSNVKK